MQLKRSILKYSYQKKKQRLKINGIQYNYNYRGNQVFTNISSPKLDSALMLLDVYRDKLKYNPKKKQWTIKR